MVVTVFDWYAGDERAKVKTWVPNHCICLDCGFLKLPDFNASRTEALINAFFQNVSGFIKESHAALTEAHAWAPLHLGRQK
jgi:hypothetical protein